HPPPRCLGGAYGLRGRRSTLVVIGYSLFGKVARRLKNSIFLQWKSEPSRMLRKCRLTFQTLTSFDAIGKYLLNAAFDTSALYAGESSLSLIAACSLHATLSARPMYSRSPYIVIAFRT